MNTAPWTTREELSSQDLIAADASLRELGFRLVRVSSSPGDSGGVQYAGIWRADGGPPTTVVLDRTSAQLQADLATNAAAGLVARDLAGEQVGDQITWSAVFEPLATGSTSPVVDLDLDSAALLRVLGEATSAGRRPVFLAAFAGDGGGRFGLISSADPGPAWMVDVDLTRARFRRLLNHRLLHGFRPSVVESYSVHGSVRYAGLWRAERGAPVVVLTDVSPPDLGRALTHWQARGFALEHLSTHTPETV